MTAFIVIAALLAIAAAVLLAWPLLRPHAEGDAPAPPRAGIAATLVASWLPLAAFGIYFWASNWSWEPADHATQASAADLRQMIEQLQSRLSRQPDDIEGWKLLGRSAAVVGDYPLARTAFGEAYTRSKGQDAEAVAGFGESLILNDEREIDGQAVPLFERALELDPDNARALWYGGIIAFRRGDLALAQQRWVELQNHDLPPDLRQVVAERLAEIERAQGGSPATVAAVAPRQASGANLTIAIAPALAGQVPPGSTLFVIARGNEGGPPLAVVRRAVGSWPVAVAMTDANAMLPGTSLAAAGPLRLVARISRQGGPVAASGDLYGEVGYDFASASPVTVTIDRIVP
ncbi:MAG TPA: tetratricopeptide repeat protein [Steroidobacteraceae bacterium]|nr:tetratricopeptide repeat protein [Steroidobacteraceae bacterium]